MNKNKIHFDPLQKKIVPISYSSALLIFFILCLTSCARSPTQQSGRYACPQAEYIEVKDYTLNCIFGDVSIEFECPANVPFSYIQRNHVLCSETDTLAPAIVDNLFASWQESEGMSDAPNENELAPDDSDTSAPTTELILEPVEGGSMPDATENNEIPSDEQDPDGEQTDSEESSQNTAENESES